MRPICNLRCNVCARSAAAAEVVKLVGLDERSSTEQVHVDSRTIKVGTTVGAREGERDDGKGSGVRSVDARRRPE